MPVAVLKTVSLPLPRPDLAGFMRCYTGPDSTPAAPCCRMFDTPPDGDVDGADLVQYLTRFEGP